MTSLTGNFIWVDHESKTMAADVTQGTFTVQLDDELLWGNESFEWTWVELLEWLNENWSTLTTDIEAFTETDENFPEFYTEHDFRHALQGALSPSFAVWHTGGLGYLQTASGTRTVPVSVLLGFLNDVGEQIIARLIETHVDARAEHAIRDWDTKLIVVS